MGVLWSPRTAASFKPAAVQLRQRECRVAVTLAHVAPRAALEQVAHAAGLPRDRSHHERGQPQSILCVGVRLGVYQTLHDLPARRDRSGACTRSECSV